MMDQDNLTLTVRRAEVDSGWGSRTEGIEFSPMPSGTAVQQGSEEARFADNRRL